MAIEQLALEEVFAIGSIAAFGVALMIVAILVSLAVYIYASLALMKIGQRRKVPNAWLAWIPIGNLYVLVASAGKPWWWMFLFLVGIIPFLGQAAILVLTVYLFYKICEALKFEPWLGILGIIPIANLVLLGILAWGKGTKK